MDIYIHQTNSKSKLCCAQTRDDLFSNTGTYLHPINDPSMGSLMETLLRTGDFANSLASSTLAQNPVVILFHTELQNAFSTS